MKKKSLITTLALTGGFLSLGLCLTSCDSLQTKNTTTSQVPISETLPTESSPEEITPSTTTPSETTPSQETTSTDGVTTSNQEGTLKQRLLSSNSETEIINILGEYSLEEIELALTDEEVQNKITLSDQFNNLQVILSSVNDTLKQISNNIASTKTVVEDDYNYIEFDVVKKYNYSFYAKNLENVNVHIQNGIMYLYSSGTSSSGTSSSDSLGSSAGVSFIGDANVNYGHTWGSNSSTSSSTSSSTGVSTNLGNSYFEPTTLHFYNISDIDVSTYSYEDISKIYKTIKTVFSNNNNKLTLQSFNFDKLQLVESDEYFIYGVDGAARISSTGSNNSTETENAQYIEQGSSTSSSIEESDSSSTEGRSQTTNSLTGTSESSTRVSGTSTSESKSETTTSYGYYSIYKLNGTNDLTLHFKLELTDDTVSLEDMLNLINITSGSFTIKLTNIYYK